MKRPFVDVDTPNPNWILLSRSINFVGLWDVTAIYKTGDVVLRGGNLYMAVRDIGNPEEDDFEIVEIRAPKRIINRSLEDVGLRDKYKLTVITIKREFQEIKKTFC